MPARSHLYTSRIDGQTDDFLNALTRKLFTGKLGKRVMICQISSTESRDYLISPNPMMLICPDQCYSSEQYVSFFRANLRTIQAAKPMSISASWATPIHDATTSSGNNHCRYSSITCRKMSWNSLSSWIVVMCPNLGTRLTSEPPAYKLSRFFRLQSLVNRLAKVALSISLGRFQRLIDLAPYDKVTLRFQLLCESRVYQQRLRWHENAVRDVKLLEDT